MKIQIVIPAVLFAASAQAATPSPLLSNSGFVVTLFGGAYNSTPPTLLNTQTSALQLDANGNLKVNVVTGGGSSGGSSGGGSTFGATFPTTGVALGGQYSGNFAPVAVDSGSNLATTIRTPIPTGGNTIGAILQAGSWTVGISGTVPLPNGASISTLQGGVYNSSFSALVSGQQVPLQVDQSGNLKVDVVAGGGAGGGGGGTSSTFGSIFPNAGTAIGAYYSGNMVRLNADSASNLDVDVQAPLPTGTNSIGAVTQGGTWSVGVTGTVSVINSLPAGTNVLGAVTQSGTWNVNNISGTVSLPTGAATAGNQTSVIGSLGAGTAATNSLAAGLVYNSSPITLANGNQAALQGTATGALQISVSQINGTNVLAGAGAVGTGAQRVAVAQDSTTVAGSTSLPSGTNTIGAVALSNTITNPTSTLTMTTSTAAYTANQLIANSAAAGSVGVPSFAIATAGGGAIIPRVRLRSNDTTGTAWGGQTIQVDLWTAAPTFVNGDRGAWQIATGSANHIGSYTCGTSPVQGDGVFSECLPQVGSYSAVRLASGTNVFWTLQTLTGSGTTGASNVWTLTAEVLN